MSEEEFENNIKLTMEMFQDKHKTLEDEHSWTWNLISSGFYEFNISMLIYILRNFNCILITILYIVSILI